MEEILKMFGGAENIWTAIKNSAGKVGVETTRMMLELFYVLKSPETGMIDKTLILTALGYQLLPEDAIPRDRFGLLGFLDNVVTIGFAYSKVKSSITPQIEQQVNNILCQWFGNSAITGDSESERPEYQPVQSANTPTPYPYSQPQKPVWNDDEDVVID